MTVRRPLVLTGGQHAELPTGDRLLGAGSNPVAKTTAYTAASWDLVLGDASGGAFTVSPPSSPSPGDEVTVVKVDSSANAVTWNGPVNSDSSGAQLVSQWAAATFCWTGSVWLVLSAPVVGGSAPSWASITGKPTFATVATSGTYSDLTGRPSLAPVATTGAYGDLTGKPVTGVSSVNTRSGDVTGLAEQATVDALAARVSAPPWAASTTYRVGDLVWQAAVLYRRNTAGTSGSTFDTSQWDVIGPSSSGSSSSGIGYPYARPPVGGWFVMPVGTVGQPGRSDGVILVGQQMLPAGTYDALGVQVATAGSTGSTLRLIVYADDGNGKPAALLNDVSGITATTTGFKTGVLTTPIVAPAAGVIVWAGVVFQGGASTAATVWETNTAVIPSTYPSGTTPAMQVNNNVSWSATGYTGTTVAPSSASGFSQNWGHPRMAFRRSA